MLGTDGRALQQARIGSELNTIKLYSPPSFAAVAAFHGRKPSRGEPAVNDFLNI